VVLGFVPKQLFYKHTWSQVTIILEPASFCLFLWVPLLGLMYSSSSKGRSVFRLNRDFG
jgi:hypothetical protein